MSARHIILSFAFYCAVTSSVEVSGESSIRIAVQINNETVTLGNTSDKKVICNVGDIINFSCDGSSITSDSYGVVYQKVGIRYKIPKEGSYETNLFDYSVKVHSFDDKTKVHCEVESWNVKNMEYTISDTSSPVTLIVKSDNLNETIPNVYYSDRNPVTHNCSGSDNHLIIVKNGTQRIFKEKRKNLAPSDTDSVIFCSEILAERKRLNKPNGRILYKRIIQKHIKYTYRSEAIETSSQSATLTSTQIGIIVGVIFIISITLVAVYILYKTKRSTPVTPLLDQDTNNGCSTELIYSELALSEAPLSGCSSSQADKASPYAEIGRVIARIPQNIEESPYAEIIFKRK